MRIFHIPAYTDNYIWVMQSGSDISIIDPGDASPVLDHIKNNDLNIVDILLTHHHFDHVGGTLELTLFSAGCGRVFEGTFEQMHDSIQKLNQLDPETVIYCAHEYTESNIKFVNSEMNDNFVKEYTLEITQKIQNGLISLPTKLKLERKINPFLLNIVPADLEGLSPLKQFTELRIRKDNF